MTGSNKFVQDFSSFIGEAMGHSRAVGEYAKIIQEKIESSLDRYQSFVFKERFTNYSDDIMIEAAQTQVSPETANDFPLNNILVRFRISPMKAYQAQARSGWYRRNYDKYRLIKTGKGKINIEIECKLILPYEGFNFDRAEAEIEISYVINHELTHAYNDYKDPNFMKGYRVAMLHGEAQKYDFLRDSLGMQRFLYLIYALSDDEIKAKLGEAPSYKNKETLEKTAAYKDSIAGKEFNAEEYFDVIASDLAGHKFSEYVTTNFGELFVDLYKRVSRQRRIIADPKILALKKSAGLLEVLEFFEPYLNSQGELLWRKLVKKPLT